MENNGLEKLEYEQLQWNENSFDDSSANKLQAMLSIWKDGNIIYLCHPNHLFDAKTDNYDTKEIAAINWDNINIEKMMKYNDFGRFSMVDQLSPKGVNQFNYLFKKVSHMLKEDPQHICSLAILEESYGQDQEPRYFVRGIVSCSKDGILLAFNPAAAKTNPYEKSSVWQKGLRFGNKTPYFN